MAETIKILASPEPAPPTLVEQAPFSATTQVPATEQAPAQRAPQRGSVARGQGSQVQYFEELQRAAGNRAVSRMMTQRAEQAETQRESETMTGVAEQASITPKARAQVASASISSSTAVPITVEQVSPQSDAYPTPAAESSNVQAVEIPAVQSVIQARRVEEQRQAAARLEERETSTLAPSAGTTVGASDQVGAAEGHKRAEATAVEPARREPVGGRVESAVANNVADSIASGEMSAALVATAAVEGAGGAPDEASRLDTRSAEGLLQSLAATSPSAFAQAVTTAKAASTLIQAQEKIGLEAGFPEIERPTGLPRQSERPQAAPLAMGGGQAPQIEGTGGREGQVLKTHHEEATGPLPAAGVSAAAAEPSGENEGNWWVWLVNRVRRFLGQLPTSDPNLSTSAGPRQQVDLTGDADPRKNAQQQRASDQEVVSQRAAADAATMAYFGENDIYPTVAQETLRPSHTPAPPPAPGGSGVPIASVPDDVRALFDQGAAPWLGRQVNEQLQQQRQNQAAYEQGSQEVRTQGEQQIADETARVRGAQEELQDQARSDVTAQRERWRQENARIQAAYVIKSQAKREEIDGQIQEKVQTAESKADQALATAEKKAETERIKAETKATAKKLEAQNRPRSWWDRVKGAVSDAINAIRDAVNAIFDALRKLVKQIIEAAKTVVRGIIEAARLVVVGLIKGFGTFLTGLVTIALVAFPETAAAAREWIDGKLSTACDAVNAAADALKEATSAFLDWVGEALDTALAVVQAAFNVALDVLEFLALGMIKLMELLAKLVELMTNIGPIVKSIWDLIQDPTPVIEAIKAYIGGLIAQVPATARSVARGAITFSDPPENHWEGIWNHLKPKLDYLAANWWEVLKATAWHLIWPFAEDSPLWTDIPELWNTIGEAFEAVWNGEFGEAYDKYLRIAQLFVGIVGLFYGWIFLGLVIGFGIAGGIAGVEAGVLPGVIAGVAAGAAIAGEIGIGLAIAAAAVEAAIIIKAGIDLIFTDQTAEENEEDYERIASSALVLAITSIMYVIGAIAARFGRAIIQRVAGRVWRRPALRGRGTKSRGDVIEVRVVLSERVLALIRGRTVTWLEVIRRNFPVIDLVEGGTITVTPRPGRAPLYRVTGGRIISVKSTSQIGASAQTTITGWIDDLAGFSSVRNVSISNPSGRTLTVAVQTPLDDVTAAALRNYANGRGVTLELVSALPPNHPAVIFPDQIPAILAAAGVVAGEEASGSEEEL